MYETLVAPIVVTTCLPGKDVVNMRRSHHPRAFAPPCQQRYEVKIDGPMQFDFAAPLDLPTLESESLLLGASCSYAGFPLRGRPRVGQSGE